jgi:hypothetical protein
MSLKHSKQFWITGSLLGLAFLILFSIRMGLLEKIFFHPKRLELSSIGTVAEKDTWMNIFQKDRKIGFSHTRFSKGNTGYHLQETVYMRINTMGMIQDINLKTDARLQPDFTMAEFNFEMNSGRFRFLVKGSTTGKGLHIQTESAGSRREMDIRVQKTPYLFAGIIDAVAATRLKPGDKFVFPIFDPATMGQAPVYAEVLGPEEVQIMRRRQRAIKVSLSFKGASQLAWIDENGNLLKEKGLLGIRLEKTNREDALDELAVKPSRDLTKTASVAANVTLENLNRLKRLKLKVGGIDSNRLQLDGGRQTFKDHILIVEKESLTDLSPDLDKNRLGALEKAFLQPEPFIQSDHPKIKELVHEILGADSKAAPLEKVRKLLDWVDANIDKRPVLSLPDALSTLEHRMGDCNEHAVLLAALARAAGIPCRVEAGLVYLKGRFYYHAWNLVYLGRWVTADALWHQLPADVSHIRLITGSQQQQLDLMGIIGKIRLKVID